MAQNIQITRTAAVGKLHGRAFYESIGAPKHILAPMVDQSEFAWRLLTRSFLPPDLRTSLLCYSPMLHAKLFADAPKYRAAHFEPLKPVVESSPRSEQGDGQPYLDGNAAIGDRPLFVQFCANDPQELLEAAKVVQPHCDAVDLNLGCPQGIAKRGHYGAFLQEDWDTIHRMINTLHHGLDIPITAKMRVLETKERTLEYAKMILGAGASILTVHGRQREQKGHNTGLADWSILRYLREQLPPETVLFANGNILQYEDIEQCLEETKFDGVMSAEGNLYDPSIFAAPPPVGQEGRVYWRGRDGKGGYRMDEVLRRYMDIIQIHVMGKQQPERPPLFIPSDAAKTSAASTTSKRSAEDDSDDAENQDSNQHLAKKQKSQSEPEAGPKPSKKELRKKGNASKYEKCNNPNLIAMQAHCFHMLRPLVSKHHNVRDALARCKAGDVDAFENVLTLVEEAVKKGLLEYEANPAAFEDEELDAPKEAGVAGVSMEESSDEAVKRCKRPWWVCQPYVRPLPKEAIEKGGMQLSKKAKRKLELEAEEARKSGVSPGGRVSEVQDEVKKEVVGHAMEEKKVANGAEVEVKQDEADQIKGEVDEIKVPREGMVCG